MTDGSDDAGGDGAERDPGASGTVRVDRRDLDEVFALLGDETRVRVLQALEGADGETLPFSELRERVGIRDSGSSTTTSGSSSARSSGGPTSGARSRSPAAASSAR
jgi:hypothetical protein